MELDYENIFTDEDELFATPEVNEEEKKDPKEGVEEEDKNNSTTEITEDTLFEDNPESVGKKSGEDSSGEDNILEDGVGSLSVFSPIATALRDDGVLPNITDEDLKTIKTSEDFAELIKKQIQSGFDERQKRIDDALDNEVPVSEIKKYENALEYLETITDESLKEEGEEAEEIRKNLIYQSYINKGFSKERAEKEVKKSFTAGTDIEDSIEARDDISSFYSDSYKKMIDEAKSQKGNAVKQEKERADKVKKLSLETEEVFGGMKLTKEVREKIYSNLTKPVFKDPDSGVMLTPIQKYEREHKEEFLHKLGVLFTLTNEFKDLDNILRTEINKASKKNLKDLERTLNSSKSFGDGSLKLMNGSEEVDRESYSGLRIDLD